MYKILKKPFFGKFMVKWRSPLTETESLEWERFTTKSKSGALIYGLFAKALTANAKATIVLAHPMGKEAKGYFLKNGYTHLLRQHGYNTILFDFNGFGESTHGNFSYFEDIVAISLKAKELTPGLQIGYHGISLGAQWATIAFADKNHKYEFAIIESAATTLEEFWVLFPMAYRTLKILNFFLPKYKQRIKMDEKIKETKNLKSILFIYSETDPWTPVSMGKTFQKNCNIATELWTVPESNHAAIMKSGYKNQYQEKIIKYFDDCIQTNTTIPVR